ncbi:PP2C family protein-serine/threonine phosphatase, partial [Blastomonas sp.]|uniref:PP2C family protein-serine/threonine phosphatase n=1 Tax=Blastomonas sp. TaxID=1909299 RepID=UPI00359479B6
GRLRYSQVQPALDLLESRAFGFGLLNGQPDADGTVRAVPMVMQTGETMVPGLALEMVRAALDSDTGTDPEIKLSPGHMRIGAHRVPLDPQGRMRLRFGQVPEAHVFSALEVLGEDFDLQVLAGKIVVVSLTAEGTIDIVSTPLGSEMFGVLVQAQAADAIRRGGWLDRPGSLQMAEWLIGVLLALAVMWLAISKTKASASWGLMAAALVVLPVASATLFVFAQQLFDPVRPLVLGGGTAFAVFAALFSEARRDRAKLRDAQSRSEGELGAARAIQLGMLPDRKALAAIDPRVEIAAQLEAAKSVGGDFYDIVPLDADRYVVIIADVTGKGVPAALFMALSKALTKSVMLRSDSDLAETAALLNTELMRDSGDQLGLTMLLCLIDLSTGAVEMVNAGHDNPLRVAPDGTVSEVVLEGGPPFCIMDYPWPSEHTVLKPGEALVLITDGVTEAQNNSDALFGNERTRTTLATPGASAAEMVDSISKAVRVFEDGADASDDLTVVAFRYLGGHFG